MKDEKKDEVLEEMDDDVIQLVSEDGETINFFHVATIEHKSEWYVFFQPAEEVEDIDEDELVIFKLTEDANGDDVFTPLEDEKLADDLYAEYEKMMEHEGECGCGCSECGGGEGGCGKK